MSSILDCNYRQNAKRERAIAYMESTCSYRHSDFLLVDFSFNVLFGVTPFEQA